MGRSENGKLKKTRIERKLWELSILKRKAEYDDSEKEKIGNREI